MLTKLNQSTMKSATAAKFTKNFVPTNCKRLSWYQNHARKGYFLMHHTPGLHIHIGKDSCFGCSFIGSNISWLVNIFLQMLEQTDQI